MARPSQYNKNTPFQGIRRCFLFPKTLAQSAHFATEPSLKKRGFKRKDLIEHWPEIVGQELCHQCRPLKIDQIGSRNGKRGRLFLSVASSAYRLEIQYAEPLILERLTRFYGYTIADEVVIVS